MPSRSPSAAVVAKLLILAVIGSSLLTFSGCGADNPSQFAGTVEPEGRKSKSPDSKADGKGKSDVKNVQP